MRKKKILHIINSLEIGGAETLLITLLNELDQHFEQHLILLEEKNNTLLDKVPGGCVIEIVPFRSVWHLPHAVLRVRRYIRKNAIGVVHTQLYWPGIISRFACSPRQKVINTIQAITSEASYKVNRLSFWLERLTYRKRHIIIAVSKNVLDDFDQWIGLKGEGHVFYNLINEQYFIRQAPEQVTHGQVRLVAVGNLRWQKNHEYLIEAFKKLPPTISLDIFGEGVLREKFEREISEHKLNIRLRGHHNNIAEQLPAFQFFVMPSLYEGFSLALMEAMATGLIPLLSDIPVLKEAGGEAAFYFDLSSTDSFIRLMDGIQSGKISTDKMPKMAMDRARQMCDKAGYIQRLIKLYNG